LRGLISAAIGERVSRHVTSRNFVPWEGGFHIVCDRVGGLGFGESEVRGVGGERLLGLLGFRLGVVGVWWVGGRCECEAAGVPRWSALSGMDFGKAGFSAQLRPAG
jgi:hypothetical protein